MKMVRKKKIIITNNREIYQKFNMLNFSPEVVLKDVKQVQVKRILKNINSGMKVLDMEQLGKYILVKKMNPLNFNIYMQRRK